MHVIDRILPVITKLYIPVFFIVSLLGCGFMYFGMGPIGFGIPLIIWFFSFIGHSVKFAFTKRLGYLSLFSCVLSADWMVGALMRKVIYKLSQDSFSKIPQLVAAVALIAILFIALIYIKVAKGLQSPVTREYTWDDFKYDLEERNERWRERADWTREKAEQTKRSAQKAGDWIKTKFAKKVEPSVLYLPSPKETSEEPSQVSEEVTELSIAEGEEITPSVFVITDLVEETVPVIKKVNEHEMVTAKPLKVDKEVSSKVEAAQFSEKVTKPIPQSTDTEEQTATNQQKLPQHKRPRNPIENSRQAIPSQSGKPAEPQLPNGQPNRINPANNPFAGQTLQTRSKGPANVKAKQTADSFWGFSQKPASKPSHDYSHSKFNDSEEDNEP